MRAGPWAAQTTVVSPSFTLYSIIVTISVIRRSHAYFDVATSVQPVPNCICMCVLRKMECIISFTVTWVIDRMDSSFLSLIFLPSQQLNSCPSAGVSASRLVPACLWWTVPLAPLLCNCLGLGWQSRPDKRTPIVSGDRLKRSVCSPLYLSSSITCVWQRQRYMMDGRPALSLSRFSLLFALTHSFSSAWFLVFLSLPASIFFVICLSLLSPLLSSTLSLVLFLPLSSLSLTAIPWVF